MASALFDNFAFDPEQLKIMAAAFDSAIVELGITDPDSAVGNVVALKIIELSQRGQRDGEQLRQQTVQAFKPQLTASRQPPRTP
jgi:hypothetical protein